jgi:hypothetical protein
MRRPRVRYTNTPKGWAEYRALRAEAQAASDADGLDRGIETHELGPHSWIHVFLLPTKQVRQGHELRCEVVACSSLERTWPGHGYR